MNDRIQLVFFISSQSTKKSKTIFKFDNLVQKHVNNMSTPSA